MNATKKPSKKIIVDIDVADCAIGAVKPEIQIPMPNDDAGKLIFHNTMPLDRLNKHTFGYLKGRALRKAERIVDKFGSIGTSGMYGSIIVNSEDFIPWEK